jgi:hypothetical protein
MFVGLWRGSARNCYGMSLRGGSHLHMHGSVGVTRRSNRPINERLKWPGDCFATYARNDMLCLRDVLHFGVYLSPIVFGPIAKGDRSAHTIYFYSRLLKGQRGKGSLETQM